MKNQTKLKGVAVACALLLATNSILADNSKTKNKPEIFHITSISLDKNSRKKAKKCKVPKDFKAKNEPRPNRGNILSLAFDPKQEQQITLQFKISKLPVSQDERVLLLLSSRCLSKKPQLQTPKSRKDLFLEKKDIKFLNASHVPIFPQKSQDVSPAATKMTIKINVNTKLLTQQYQAGNDTFYLQGALLKKSDFQKKNYNGVILSPLEAIHITPGLCPTETQFVHNFNSVNKVCKKR